jgi:hypothetical protein
MRALFRGKCRYLCGHPGFRRAPASRVFHLTSWRLHCTLRGAAQIIAHPCPTILFEANAAAAMQFGLEQHGAWELLKSWGYRFFSVDGYSDLCELDKPPTVDTIDNVIAVHDKRCKE